MACLLRFNILFPYLYYTCFLSHAAHLIIGLPYMLERAGLDVQQGIEKVIYKIM